MPTDARFALDAPVGGPQLTPPLRMFNLLIVRDTVSRFPSTLIAIRVVRGRTIFTIDNQANQTLTATLIGDVVNNPLAPDIGGATTIAASTKGTLSTDVYSPYLGIRLSYGTAPASGTGVTVDAVTETGR